MLDKSTIDSLRKRSFDLRIDNLTAIAGASNGSPLQGHPATFLLPGIEASTGSLGQGTPMAIGMAMASKLDGDKFRVYAIVGDGESQEGQVLDHNKGQIDGFVKDVMDIEPIADNWRAFNWNVLSIDGHDYQQIGAALESARATNVARKFLG